MAHDVTRHPTADGRTVYRLPLEVFPAFEGNAYLITGGEQPVLVDCGSGQSSSNRDLEHGFEQVRTHFGETVGFEDLGAIIITHGHIDHFGGLPFVRARSRAAVGIHRLDRRVLTQWEKRLNVASRQIAAFLRGVGVSPERQSQHLETYQVMKRLFRSTAVDFSFEEGPILEGTLEAIHVPGHCSGQVCLRLGDVLLSADHVLAGISPHLAPEQITPWTGVGHYFESLTKIERLEGLRLGLGGHKGPIDDLRGRIAEIRRLHENRHAEILALCAEPRTTSELSREVFGRVRSYHVLLALLETGAQLEYLDTRGELVPADTEDRESSPVLRWVRA